MAVRIIRLLLLLAVVGWWVRCEAPRDYELDLPATQTTLKVVMVVIDGPRLVDTWAHPQRRYIPYQHRLSQEGIFFPHFFNDGDTYTLSGHAALTTGAYERMKNDGSERPALPSIFQRYLAAHRSQPTDAILITSKEKLRVLANCQSLSWRDSFLPVVEASDREDSVTLRIARATLENYQPTLTLIHFREPDRRAHQNDWQGYLEGIRTTDRFVWQLWKFLQEHEAYRSQTVLLVTNDHGRHLNGINGGFAHHGDQCAGCRHISLLALGPHLRGGQTVANHYGLVDVAPTVALLLNVSWPDKGHPITELLNH